MNQNLPRDVESLELAIKLEAAQQQLGIIGFENDEYKKEINELKQQNEQLRNENGSFIESAQRDQQAVSYLQSISADIDVVNAYNANLSTKLSEYKKSLKILSSNNEFLQKENAKFQKELEKIIEEKQRQCQIYSDNMIALENKIKALEVECDALRDDHVATLNVLQTVSDSGSDEKQFEPTTSPQCEERIKTVRLRSLRLNPYASTVHNMNIKTSLLSDCEMDSNEPVIYDNDVQLMSAPITPCTQFVYNDDIIAALQQQPSSMHLNDTIDSNRAMVAKLTDINYKKDHKIQKLQKQIKILEKRNNALSKNIHNKSCMAWVWTK